MNKYKSEYSKWFWSECDQLNKDTSFAHSLAGKSWNHQQSKIDLLEKELTETQAFLNKQNHIKQAKIEELQARVDGALKHLDLAYPESWGYCVDQAIDILKGNKDEN